MNSLSMIGGLLDISVSRNFLNKKTVTVWTTSLAQLKKMHIIRHNQKQQNLKCNSVCTCIGLAYIKKMFENLFRHKLPRQK